MLIYVETLHGCLCCEQRSHQILNKSNNVTFEVRPLYKMMRCSTLGNGDIQMKFGKSDCLTLKAPITTAAEDKFCDVFPNF